MNVKTIIISPYTFRIEIVISPMKDGAGNDLDGQIHYDDPRIQLDAKLADVPARIVLFHECLHAIGEVTGQKLNEGQINALAYGLVRFARDNPEFWGLLAQ